MKVFISKVINLDEKCPTVFVSKRRKLLVTVVSKGCQKNGISKRESVSRFSVTLDYFKKTAKSLALPEKLSETFGNTQSKRV